MKLIYRFMDSEGRGEIGFHEFTLLSEERWKALDVYAQYLKGVEGREQQLKKENEQSSETSSMTTTAMGSGVADAQGYAKLEKMSRNHTKIPLRSYDQSICFQNINRDDPSDYLTLQKEMPVYGRANEPIRGLTDVIQHEHLRQSLVDRIEQKNLIKDARKNDKKFKLGVHSRRPTKA